MIKYGSICLLFFLNSEVVSLIALNILLLMFFCDCVKERFF